jgi:hypothetical protein
MITTGNIYAATVVSKFDPECADVGDRHHKPVVDSSLSELSQPRKSFRLILIWTIKESREASDRKQDKEPERREGQHALHPPRWDNPPHQFVLDHSLGQAWALAGSSAKKINKGPQPPGFSSTHVAESVPMLSSEWEVIPEEYLMPYKATRE